jgi:hypothetical protein
MPLTLQFPPPQTIECRVLVRRFDITPGQTVYLRPDRIPEEDDIVAVNINGFTLLAAYGGDYVVLGNSIHHYEFSLIGVVEDP